MGDNPMSIFIGGFFLFAWYIECLVQVVMAVNRLIIITFKKYDVFTYRFTLLIFFLLVSFTAVSAYSVQSVLPCCQYVVIRSQLYPFTPIPSQIHLRSPNSPHPIHNKVPTTNQTLCSSHTTSSVPSPPPPATFPCFSQSKEPEHK